MLVGDHIIFILRVQRLILRRDVDLLDGQVRGDGGWDGGAVGDGRGGVVGVDGVVVVQGGGGGRGGEVGEERVVRAGEVLEVVGQAGLVHVDVGRGGVFGLFVVLGTSVWGSFAWSYISKAQGGGGGQGGRRGTYHCCYSFRTCSKAVENIQDSTRIQSLVKSQVSNSNTNVNRRRV